MNNYIKEKIIISKKNISKDLISKEFLNKVNLCKNDLVSNLLYWICEDILAGEDISYISNKFINKYDCNNLLQTPCEIFEIFNSYKNSQVIDYKKARYLYYCNGILATTFHFNSKGKFEVIFLTVKDIIRELDGDEFFIWLKKMCTENNNIN